MHSCMRAVWIPYISRDSVHDNRQIIYVHACTQYMHYLKFHFFNEPEFAKCTIIGHHKRMKVFRQDEIHPPPAFHRISSSLALDPHQQKDPEILVNTRTLTNSTRRPGVNTST